MKIGTRSLLFGAHQFILHPICVLIGWWKLYGFAKVPYRPISYMPTIYPSLTSWRLWLAVFMHDLGYVGLKDMDGEEGSRHPYLSGKMYVKVLSAVQFENAVAWEWLIRCHSRHTHQVMLSAYGNNVELSPLAHADKLATALMPSWLYITMVRATGEIREYQRTERHASDGGYIGYDTADHTFAEDVAWFRVVKHGFRKWIRENPYRGFRIRHRI